MTTTTTTTPHPAPDDDPDGFAAAAARWAEAIHKTARGPFRGVTTDEAAGVLVLFAKPGERPDGLRNDLALPRGAAEAGFVALARDAYDDGGDAITVAVLVRGPSGDAPANPHDGAGWDDVRALVRLAEADGGSLDHAERRD